MIKKIYKLMKNKGKNNNWTEIKEKAIKDCEKYFTSEANVGHLIKFVKQKMENQHH